jgi:PAS domain S-box-containing protein
MPTLAVRESATSSLALRLDWAGTPLGPFDGWPPALVTTAQLCLNSQFPMCLAWGPELTQIYNDGYIPILGAKHPAAFGRPAREAWAEIWEMMEARLQTVVTTGEPWWFDDMPVALTRHGAPEEGYFTFSCSPLRDEQGTGHGFLAIAHETTRVIIRTRRQRLLTSLASLVGAAPSIEELWTRLQEALDPSNPDTARLALYGLDENGKDVCVLWTSGAAAPESPWPPCTDLVCRVWTSAARDSETRAASAGRVRPLEGTRTRLTPLWGLNDELLAMLAVDPGPLVAANDEYDDLLLQVSLTVEDQVHRLQGLLSHMDAVQAELSDTEVRYRSLFESTQDGVLYSTPDGTIHGANPAACTMLGYGEAELITLRREDIFFPDDEEVAEAVRRRRDEGQFSGELTFRRADGAPMRVDLTSTVFIDTTGQERVVTIFRDVTERRRLEMRTEEMRRMDTLGQLTGGVAHDFNNLLTVILSAAETIQEEESLTEAVELAGTIQQAASKAASLTKQLLAFARRQPLHPQPTDLHVLFVQLGALLQRALSETVSIRFEPGKDVWVAQVDPAQLEVAVLNLALNARDAMPTGGLLTIGTRNHPVSEAEASADLVAGDYVELFVRDTGTGMPPEVAGRAFEPFFTTKEPGRGTGLGLSMVYGVVRQLGGSVSIDSALGRGTTVRLLLPRAAATPAGATPSDASGLARARPGEVVLAVEDNDLLRTLVQSLLGRLGYEVITAGTAQEALRVLEGNGRVDLLFTDVVMPGGVDGRQLAQRVRVLRPGIGVLLTSGYMNPHSVAPLTAKQPHERLLPKPYQLAVLAQAVRTALDERPSRS